MADSAVEAQNLPKAKPDSAITSERYIGVAYGGSPEPEPHSVVPGHALGEDSHEANHDDQPFESSAQVNHVRELDDQVVAGINTTSSDLKALLVPGTIVHFWASWCRPCEEEFPELESFYREHISEELKVKGIRLITISNDFKVAPAARFIDRHGVSFPVYLDTEQTTNLAIVGQRILPSTVIVDADGRFHRLALGKLDWNFPRMPDLLAATARKRSVAAEGAEKLAEEVE